MVEPGVVADETTGEFGLWIGEYVKGFTLFDDGPVIDDGDMRADGFDDIHLVGDDDDSQMQLTIQPFDKFENRFGGVRVECAGRLVKQQDTRVVGERAGDGDSLLLSSGQL